MPPRSVKTDFYFESFTPAREHLFSFLQPITERAQRGTPGPCRHFLARRIPAMDQPGLHDRHRNKDGEISRKHGNTLIRTLRRVYGSGFAAWAAADEKLEDVLAKLDEHSLSQLARDHEHGELEGKIAVARTGAM
jgi:hypothetical protein